MASYRDEFVRESRARLLVAPASSLLKSNDEDNTILLPLKEFGGMIWPYSPNITVSHNAMYGEYDITHTNYTQHYFQKSQPSEIQVDGQFTAQTQAEASYMLAVLHFLRIVTKMNFGLDDPKRGTPPPILYFSAYGDLVFYNVPVLVKNVAYALPNDVDYVEHMTDAQVQGPGGYVWDNRLPTMMTISCTLGIQPTPNKMRAEWNMNDFKSGKLVNKGYI